MSACIAAFRRVTEKVQVQLLQLLSCVMIKPMHLRCYKPKRLGRKRWKNETRTSV